MKTIGLAGIALLAAQLGWADCERPQSPVVPDGSTAEREQMLEARGAVQSYIEAGNAYLDCLKQQESETNAAMETAGKTDEEAAEEIAERSKARVTAYNAAVDEMQEVGDRFNEALKAFNARQK